MPDTYQSAKAALAADKAAIADVIHRETECFRDMDFVGWAACRLQSDRACDVSIAPRIGISVVRGWDAIQAEMAAIVAEGRQPCGMISFRQDNLQIQVEGDVAWTTHDGWMKADDGTESTTFETRILERTAEGWRIVYLGFAQHRDSRTIPGSIALDADGRIVWSAPGALETLKDHPALVVSHGRLRAQRPLWDRTLQAALARAAALHGFFQHRRFIEDTGAPFRTPVILGEDDSGAAIVCVLLVSDGMTYVEFDQVAGLERRMATAQAIFGLSPGQMALARRIASGDSLTAAAEQLGITINTARTHLKRIYDKTGVNAQTSLVRLLLSVG
jgi:DNA-binding CsgD family transcriptional regulator/ketosteroid isomerase-like protein